MGSDTQCPIFPGRERQWTGNMPAALAGASTGWNPAPAWIRKSLTERRFHVGRICRQPVPALSPVRAFRGAFHHLGQEADTGAKMVHWVSDPISRTRHGGAEMGHWVSDPIS